MYKLKHTHTPMNECRLGVIHIGGVGFTHVHDPISPSMQLAARAGELTDTSGADRYHYLALARRRGGDVERVSGSLANWLAGNQFRGRVTRRDLAATG